MIKEVNPLILEWFLAEYDPKVVYLIRHPVSVANSFYVQGWTEEQFRPRFSSDTLLDLEVRYHINHRDSFWEQSGALQGVVENIVSDTLALASDFLIVKYEELCSSPLEHFTKLFTFANLRLSDDVIRKIEQTTGAQGSYRPGRGGIVRDSAAMIDRWRSVPEQTIRLVRRGYFANHPRYYIEDW